MPEENQLHFHIKTLLRVSSVRHFDSILFISGAVYMKLGQLASEISMESRPVQFSTYYNKWKVFFISKITTTQVGYHAKGDNLASIKQPRANLISAF